MEWVQQQDVLIVRFHGELDNLAVLRDRETLMRVVDEIRSRWVVMNFKDVTFIDSSGIGLILGRYNQISEYGGSLLVCDLTPMVARLFDLTGMHKIITRVPNEKEALNVLGVKA